MAYFNNCTLSTSDEFNAYPNQIPASEQAQSDTLANGWRVGRLPSYVVDEPTNLGAETNLGKYECSFLNNSGLTCISLQSLCLRRRTTGMTPWRIRKTIGL